MKKIIIFIVFIIMLSCGGKSDIIENYLGNYVAVDSHIEELFYGCKLISKRKLELWYLNKNGNITIKPLELKNFDIFNYFRYFYNSDNKPTWIYEYSSKDVPIKLVFFEFADASVIPYLFMTNNELNYLDFERSNPSEIDGIDNSIDDFRDYAMLKNVESDWEYPILNNFSEINFTDFLEISNKYFNFNGVIQKQNFTKKDLSYYNLMSISYIEGTGKYRWDEYNIIDLELPLDNIKINLYTNSSRSDTEPSDYSFQAGSNIDISGKVVSYTYTDDNKTNMLLNVQISN
ncbi:MAG: hypothetical protein OCD02_20675 [Spirochaetaceae bacterium]